MKAEEYYNADVVTLCKKMLEFLRGDKEYDIDTEEYEAILEAAQAKELSDEMWHNIFMDFRNLEFGNVPDPEDVAAREAALQEIEDGTEQPETGDDGEYRDTETVITEETIAGEIRIAKGEKRTFANKILHFKGKVICEGELEFNNCTIYYHETDSESGICYDVDYDMGIELESESSVTIRDSVVICKGIAAKYFLSGRADRICIENTRFEDCSYFFNADVDYGFQMVGCEVNNCCHKLVEFTYHVGDDKPERRIEICHNRIIYDTMTTFHVTLLRCYRHLTNSKCEKDDEDKRLGAIFDKLDAYSGYGIVMINIREFKQESINFFDNYIEETERFTKLLREYHIIYQHIEGGDNIFYNGCTFKNLSSLMFASFVRNCRFEDCTQGISLKTMMSKWQMASVMDSCVFKNCTKIIFTHKGTRINNCQFVDCYGRLITDDIASSSDRGGVIISGCSFFNTSVKLEEHKYRSSILMSYFINNDSVENIIKDCVFDGGQMEDTFLIAASGWNGKYKGKKIIRIQNCVFRNFTTERSSGKIIKEYEKYTRRHLFKEKDENYHVNVIENCTGLDMVNKEGSKAENYEIMRFGSDGGEVGCSFEV